MAGTCTRAPRVGVHLPHSLPSIILSPTPTRLSSTPPTIVSTNLTTLGLGCKLYPVMGMCCIRIFKTLYAKHNICVSEALVLFYWFHFFVCHISVFVQIFIMHFRTEVCNAFTSHLLVCFFLVDTLAYVQQHTSINYENHSIHPAL